MGVAKAVDKVFYVPLASGLAAWAVAMVTEWRKIEKSSEPEAVAAAEEEK